MAEYGPSIKLTGLWQKTSAKGVVYFIGRLGAARLVLLPNRNKKADSDPDYHVFVQERQEEQKPQQQSGQQSGKAAFDDLDIPDPGPPVRRRRYEPEREF